jgi:Plasmid pRiA4b ORF-3-like protein
VVYQPRVVLAQISPLIWRRLLITGQTTIAELHQVLQTVFGWSDEHLHRFTIHGVEYGLWRPGSCGFSHDAHTVTLARFGLREGERFTYEYNFFDAWRHDMSASRCQIITRMERAKHRSMRDAIVDTSGLASAVRCRPTRDTATG